MPTLCEMNFEEDFGVAKNVDDSNRWSLEKIGGLEVWASISPASHPNEIFQARLIWKKYPQEAPSLKFRDPATGRVDLTSAWPKVRGFRPTSFDTCVNWTAEGLKIHPEWNTDNRYKWDPHGNVLLRTLRILIDELDGYFEGRHP